MNAPFLIIRRQPADLDTPVGVFLKTSSIEGVRFLLESVEGGAARGRYSVIGLQPDCSLIADEKQATLNVMDGTHIVSATPQPTTVLEATRQFVEAAKMRLPEGIPSMAAGVFGYLGYDTIRHVEAIPPAAQDPLQLPEIILVRPSVILIFDHVTEEMLLCAPVYPADGGTRERAETLLDVIIGLLRAPVPDGAYAILPSPLTGEGAPLGADEGEIAHSQNHPHRSLHNTLSCQGRGEGLPQEPTSNMSATTYMERVGAVKNYIAAGDIFQGVLSQRFELPFEHHPLAFYRALRKTNPAPYLFYFDFDDFQIAGSSPEILVKLQGDVVTIRPIAGTRKRGATHSEDAELAADLLADPKERAEHLMLLDLGRNDVGKVAQLGSVKVTDQFFLEYYSHVMHIVSNVEGKLAHSFDALDALFSGFPAGTVSGAPKVRAMEIINELEPVKRGVYGGGVGYFSANGDMDTCIALRTAVIKNRTVYIQAGAGIVADSVPEMEQAECENKARALVKATHIAVQYGVGQ